ncbi:MAG: hypothetical protein DWQ31_13050 [Planctomycetota bacterium]|nr:MAG: hypothetical protein DWQ31_13050 [Planctomycetota bacterium]REJ95246.1 MAG: hypothetical protein DWQ35_06830 [Planctomycetota bacterium]REK27020.1 MAG: hypothetical protein DWQ42_08145 [Planctomycetota bacterium]REK40319.1 MAG: hypothetical protein DWQ46_16735 [Planctomycetota bacterium]
MWGAATLLFFIASRPAPADEVVLINDPIADGIFTEDGVTGYQYVFDFYWGDSSFHTGSSSTCVGQCLGYSSEFALGGSNTPFNPAEAAWYREGTVSYRAFNTFAGGDIEATFEGRGIFQGWYQTNTAAVPGDYHDVGPFGCQNPGCPYTNWNLPAATGNTTTDVWDTNVIDEYGSFGPVGSQVPWAMENTWHVPSDYTYSTLELAPGEFFGGSSFNIDPTEGFEVSSQIDQWQGPPNQETWLLATIRIVHPNSPGSMEWFSADGSGVIQGPTGAPFVPPTCIIGDVNCDGYVEIGADILTAFTNFTGPGSFGRVRAQGDVHGPTTATTDPDGHDGDVDVSDILTIFGAFTGPPPDDGSGGLGGPAEAGDPSVPDLIYDPTTGEVVLDPDGSSIIGYSLQNATNSFLPGNHTPILAGVATALTSQIEEAALAPGSGSIGLVFPTGLDLAGLQALLTVNQVSRSLGAPLVPFDLVVLGGAPVPEMSTLALGALGLLALTLFGLRRRTW